MNTDCNISECFSPNELYHEGIRAFNQGKDRQCALIHPKAILAFNKGWDKAQEVNSVY